MDALGRFVVSLPLLIVNPHGMESTSSLLASPDSLPTAQKHPLNPLFGNSFLRMLQRLVVYVGFTSLQSKLFQNKQEKEKCT